jgi:glyoxylase-like metal-dependent hydrolase (beta-lactamase superfamily II)
MRAHIVFAITVLAAVQIGFEPARARAQQPPQTPILVTTDTWLLRDTFLPRREPDGATVIFRAPEGLIVLDTGRHRLRQDEILGFARGQGVPIIAIVNSHWHLDHTSGNGRLLKAYPTALVISSRAVEGALAGFLPKSAADSQAYLASGQADPATAEDLRGDLAVIADPYPLKPTFPIESSQRLKIGGRLLEVRLAKDAATAGDVWLYDPKIHVAAVGDLVTLPAPFLDTACPAGWRRALDEIRATPFTVLIPGHGPPLSRSSFETYRKAFGALVDCSAGQGPKEACADAWAEAVGPMLDPGPLAQARAKGMTRDYVDMLRANGGKSRFCEAAA